VKTKQILLPFQFKRWLKILLIVWIAGQAAGFGGNFNPARRFQQAQDQTSEQLQTPAAQTTQPQQAFLDDITGIPQAPAAGAAGAVSEPVSQSPLENLSPIMSLALILIVLVLAILFMWLSARFNFIFLDLVVTGDVRLGESFRAQRVLGNSYFRWMLGYLAVMIGGMILFVLPIVFVGSLALLMVPLFILFMVAAIAVGVFVLDFVIPIMYREQIRCMEACRKFLSFKVPFGSLALYLLVKIGFGILSAIIAALAALIVGVLLVIVALTIAIPGGFIAGAVAFLKPLLTVLGVILLVVSIFTMVIVIGFILLPIPLFFRAFALTYLTRLIPDYDLLGFSRES